MHPWLTKRTKGDGAILALIRTLPPVERNKNGDRFPLTKEQRRQVRKLIKETCCNYRGGDCLLLDDGGEHRCSQVLFHTLCCKWFRWAVLPLDPVLEQQIIRRRERKRCALCGGDFLPGSNRAKYCGSCAKEAHRKQKAASIRNKRAERRQLGA